MKLKSLFSGRVSFTFFSTAALACAFWFVLLYAKGLSKATDEVIPLRHEGRRIVVPEHSPLRKLLLIEPVSEQLVISPFTLPAIIEADPATMIKVLAPLPGRIIRLNKHLGDSVNVGDVLFIMDSADLAQARSDTERAKSALIFAQENLKRQQRLSVSNIAARRDLQQARNDYEQALSEQQRANARLSALNVEKTDDKQLVIRSPLPGQVISLNAAMGSYWNDLSTPIMEVADLSQVYVTASAQEKDLKHLYVDQTVDISLDAYSQHVRSKVNYIGALLNPETRTVDVNMILENPLGQLKPNMFAKATFLSQPHRCIILPLSTVIQRGFNSIVFIEIAPWQFEPRILKLGSQIGNNVEVLSGLKPHERVVIKGGIILND